MILGDSSFVEEVLKPAEEEIARKADSAHRGITFDELIKLAAQRFGLEPGDLLRPGKQPSRVPPLSGSHL